MLVKRLSLARSRSNSSLPSFALFSQRLCPARCTQCDSRPSPARHRPCPCALSSVLRPLPLTHSRALSLSHAFVLHADADSTFAHLPRERERERCDCFLPLLSSLSSPPSAPHQASGSPISFPFSSSFSFSPFAPSICPHSPLSLHSQVVPGIAHAYITVHALVIAYSSSSLSFDLTFLLRVAVAVFLLRSRLVVTRCMCFQLCLSRISTSSALCLHP